MFKKRNAVWKRSILILFATLALTTCNIFKAGLGTKIDINGPSVSVNSVANGAYLRGTVTMAGDASDVLDVKSVTVIVSINNNQIGAIPATLASNYSWTATLDTKALSGMKDTQANLDIRVAASSGKSTDENMVVYFDNNKPVIATMTPSEAQLTLKDALSGKYLYALSQTELITGSVTDFALNNVTLTMGTLPTMTCTTKSTFSFSVDATQFYDPVTYAPKNVQTGKVVSGSGSSSVYEVPYTLVATDLAGNQSLVSDKLYVAAGNGAPTVSFTSPTTFNASAYYPYIVAEGAANSIQPGTTITIHAFDMDGLDDKSAQGIYVAYAPASSPLTPADYDNPLNLATPGKFTILTSGSGLTVTPTTTMQTSGGALITQGADIKFSLPITVGQNALLIHIDDLKTNKVSGATASYILPTPPSASGSPYFASLFVSTGIPQVSVSSIPDFVKSLSATGTVNDSTGPLYVNIRLDEVSPVPQNIANLIDQPLTVIDPSTGGWAYAPTLTDGTFLLSLYGTNITYATGPTVQRTFTVDNAAPTCVVNVPGNYASSQTQYWLTGATLSTSGTASDGTGVGVANVYYAITPKGSAAPSPFPGAGWTLAAGAGSWNATVSLSSLTPTEGEFTLYLAAVDSLGNAATAYTSRNFGVDQHPPTLTETNHPATSFTMGTYALAGNIGDTNALASLTITESKDAGPANAVTFTPSVTLAGAQSATYASQSLPIGGVSSGSYAYVLTATDVAGKTTVVNRTINIDTTPPTVTLGAIPAWVSSAAYTISGTGGDSGSGASGVASIQYQMDGGSLTSATWTDSSGGANTNGTWSATLSGMAEGNHALIVQATDAAGNVSLQRTAAFGVDLNPPNLAVNAVPATITAATGASFTGISGALYDTNPAGPATLSLTSTRNGSIVVNNVPVSYPGTSYVSGNPWTYAFGVDVAGHGTDGLWTFAFTATDVAGKTTTVSKTLTIDTTPPTTTVTSPSVGSWVSTTSLSVTGVASDGTGTGVSKVYVKADGPYVAASGTDHSSEDPTSDASWTLATGQTNWSASLTLSGEGYKTLWVKAVDVAGNMTTATGAISSKVDFGLDLNPPTLGFSDIVGTLVNSLFTLSGTTADTNSVAAPTLAVVVDGGASQAVTVTAGSWAFPVVVNAVTHANDGSHTYVFTSTDVSGKTTTLSRTITVDTTPPTTAITQPGSYVPAQIQYWLSGSTASLGGSSADAGASASGVSKVYYKVDAIATSHAADDPVVAGWLLATGTTTWSATVNLATTGEGQFTLWTAAYDNADNLSSISSRSFGVDQNPPTLTEGHAPTTSTKSAYTMAGSVGDTNALASLSITESKNAGPANAVTFTPSVTLAGAQSATYASQSLPLGGVADGSYAYVLTAKDVAGKTLVVNRTVNIDTTPPTVALNAIPSWISSTAYTISGTGGDSGSGASGVASIQYQLDGGSWTSATWTDTSGGANTTGTWSSTLSGLAEGNHTIVVRATDAASNVTTLGSSAFGVDLNPPNLVVGAVPATITAATGSSFTGFSGTLYDTNPAGLAALAVTSTQNGTTVANNASIPYPGTSYVSGNPWTYAFSVDVAGHGTDGLWTFVFTATDVAGKTSSVTKSITIDTQPPTTTVTSPSSGSWVSTTSLSPTGVASDGTGTGVSKVYVKADGLYVAASGTDHGAEDPTNVVNGWTLATGQTSWSASLTLSGEGRKTLWIKAIDAAGNMTTAAGAVSSRIDFGLDLNPPTLGFSDLVGTLVNSLFTLSGATIDTNPTAPPTLAVVVDGGASQSIPVSAGVWNYAVSVDTATHTTDGTHTYVFTSTDVAGKTTTLSRTITVDTTPPTTAITQPGSYVPAQPQYWLSGSTASLGGAAADAGASASGVSNLYYKVDAIATSHAADNPVSAGWLLAAGTTTWSATVNLATTGEGQFTLWTAAYDNAGNLSSISSRNFGVDQNPPSLTETNHAAVSATKSAYTLAGTIGDTNALASLTITESKNAGPANAVAFTPSVTLAGAQSATYASQSLPLGGVADGSYAYVLTATDAAGKTTVVNRTINIDTTPPTVALNAIPPWISSTAYTISGTGTDPNVGASGVASIQYQLDGGSWTSAAWTDTSGGANTTGTWSSTLSGLAEGNHTIVVRATDAASNVTTLGSSAFGVDLNPPNLTETYLSTTSQVTKNSSFTMTGSVGDTNPVSVAGTTLTVSVSVNGGAAAAATIVGSTWSYTQPKVDGIYSYVITATDAAGKTTSLNRLALLDSTPPTLTVSAPSYGSWTSSASLSVSGTSQDGSGSGVNKIYFLVDAAANDHTGDIATWNATDGSSAPSSSTSAVWTATGGLPGSWTGSSSLSGEGAKYLWVVAADKAGNTTSLTKVAATAIASGSTYTIASIGTTDFTALGASGNTVGLTFVATASGSGSSGSGQTWYGNGAAVGFGYDVAPPALSETAIGTTSTVSKNSTVLFSGTVGDSDALASANFLTVSVDGGAATAVPFTVAPNWNYSYAVNASTHAQDGTHGFIFTATDVAGKTTTLSRTILVDTVQPTLVVASPTYGSWTTSSTVTATGTSQDDGGSGVNKVYYLIDAAANDHTADIATWNATNGSSAPSSSTSAVWTATGGLPSSWSGTSVIAGEGAKLLWIVAADKAGNTTTLTKVAATAIASGSTYTIASIGTTDFTALGASGNTVGLTFVATASGSGSSGSGQTWYGNGAAEGFGYDVAPPSLTETAINTTATLTENANVTFSGLASDSDALAATHALTVSVDGGAAIDVSFTVAPAWSYTYSVDKVAHTTDGTHSFLFRATDIAGKITTVARTILVDTTPAFAIIASPSAATWTHATPYTVSGTASDGTGAGVAQVWTIVDAAATSHAGDSTTTITTGGTWTLASGTNNWTSSWSLGAEGNKTLWVAVLDLAGNWSTSYANVNFGYDATPPTLAVNAMAAYNAAFSISGTVSDSASGMSSLQYKIDSGTFTAVTIAASWNAAISAATFSALTEGTHTVTVQATDVAGNQSTQASTFSKDTTPPILSYSNISIAGGTVVQDTNPILSGTLADVGGVASATYMLQNWNYSTSTWNTIASGASLGSPANSANWTWTLNLSSTGLGLPDGRYQITIGASDVPGNAIPSPVAVPFLLSRTSPGLVVASPSLGTFQNAAFPLVGTASDPNGVTQVRTKLATGTVDFSSGTTAAYPALPVTVATGTPGVFATVSPHGLNVNDQVYVWANPMPVAPAGSLQAGSVYYVQSTPTTTSFMISATSGGAAIAINTSAATSVLVGIVKDTFPTFHPTIPVTVNTGTSTMTAAGSHGLSDGDVVYFQGTALPNPTAAATAYYVVSATATTFQVSTTSGGGALALTTVGTSVSVWSPTCAINWLVPGMSVASFSDGALTAYAQATAGSSKTGQASRDFTLDKTAPTISLSSPSSGTRTVGNLTLVGTTSDSGSIPSGVTGTIQYQIGKNYNLGNPSSWTSANVSGGSYSWTITLGDMSSYANATFATECDTGGSPATGTNLWRLPIVFQALDKAGNVAQLISYYLILDPNGNVPVVTITQPATGLTFGGQQTITGTATQPVAIYSVEVAVDPAGGNNFPANPVSVSISGQTLTAASHPFTNGMMLFLSGTTAPQISGVSVSSTTPYWVVNATAGTFQLSAASGGTAVTFSSAGTAVTASPWAPATLTTTGNNVIWYYNINTTNAYPQGGASSQTITLQARAWNSPTVGGSKGTISGLLTAPFNMTFNSSFPQVQSVQVNGQNYYSQITAAGTYALTATVSSTKGIAKLETVESSPLSGSTVMYNVSSSYGTTAASKGSYWSSTVTPPAAYSNDTFGSGNTKKVMITASGSDPTVWINAGAPTSTPGTVFVPSNVTINATATGGSFLESDASGNFLYSISMSVASSVLFSGITGQYVFNIRATDMTSPVAEVTNQPITINEDNYYPTATIASSSTVVGSQFVVQGATTDSGGSSGPISDFSKIVVYFVRSSSVLNLNTGATGATSSINAKDMNNGGTVGSVVYPGAGTYLELSIDTLSENNSLPTAGGTDTNGDGFMESLTINGSSYSWMGQIDSTKLSDGPVEIHYVAFDAAGNATHYVQSAFVSNSAPTISDVVIGTDLTGAGTINATSTFSSGYSATGFTAVNNRLYFKLDTLKGNGSLSYSLKNNGNEYWGKAGTTVAGNTITLNMASVSPTIADATGNGAQFVLTITDSTPGTPQTASVTIGMNVQNMDNVKPTVTINPLYWTDATHNSIYQASSANGHVDLGSLTTSSNPYYTASPYALPPGLADADPKVSGAITFTGTVADNQRISKLTMKIGTAATGYDFAGGTSYGTTYDVATWNGSNLVGADQWSTNGWRLTISNESLTNGGHAANWQLDWNSAKLNTVAGPNVIVSVTAADASANASTAVTSQIDVVPYIVSLTTKITGLLSSDFTRTASGQYPVLYQSSAVANSESFLVNGFNLKPTTLSGASSDIRLSKLYPSGFNNNATPARTGVGLTGSGVNSTYTQMTVNIQQASLGNGYLTVITNGIPSINNVDDNTKAYDTQASATVASMNDDVSLSLWDITPLRSTATYAKGAAFVSMALSGDTPQFAYSNNTYGYGINFFHNGTTEQKIYENWNFMTYSALGLNSAGSRIALYDVNVAQTGVNYYSDWGGIMANCFYNPQATAWNTNSYYYRAYNIWLDNLHIAGNLATLDRYQFPDVAVTGNDACSTVFYSVYDQINDQIFFRTFKVGTNSGASYVNSTNNMQGSQATALFTNLSQLNENGTWPPFTDVGATNYRFTGGGTANNNSGNTPGAQTIASGCGPYTAVGATSGGSAILVYYQTATNRLVYSYNDTPTNSGTWSAPVTLATLVGGDYVHMKVDASNHVHLAYYDSFNGGVKYIYVPTYSSPATNTQVVVDNYLTAGDKMSLTVDASGKPYITYKGIGDTGKVAWLTGGIGTLADGVNASKQFNGVWEVQVIPNKIVDSDSNRFQVGVGATTNRPVVGYSNNATGAKGIEYLTRTADLAQ